MREANPKPRRSRTIRAAGYFLFLLVFVEASLRGIFAIPALQPLLTTNDTYTWQRQWVRRQREAGHEVFYSFDRYHPTLGWFNAPFVRDLPVFEGKFLNTNSQGFRGVEEVPLERIPGRARILLLGDSFTFGDEVSDDETYASYLRTLLPGAEVINMGVHGYGHDQMLLLFLEKGLPYRPDVVVLGFIHADLDRNLLRFRDYAKPVFAAAGGALVLRNSPVPAPEDVLRWDWLRPRLIDAGSMIAAGAAESSGRREADEMEVTRRIFDQLVEAVRFSGAEPVFFYLPFGPEIESAAAQTDGERFFFDYCQTNPAVHCFTARPEFTRQIQQGVRFKTAFHWAAPGHAAVARAIADALSTHGLLP